MERDAGPGGIRQSWDLGLWSDRDSTCIPEAEETGAKRVPRAEEARVGREEVP